MQQSCWPSGWNVSECITVSFAELVHSSDCLVKPPWIPHPDVFSLSCFSAQTTSGSNFHTLPKRKISVTSVLLWFNWKNGCIYQHTVKDVCSSLSGRKKEETTLTDKKKKKFQSQRSWFVNLGLNNMFLYVCGRPLSLTALARMEGSPQWMQWLTLQALLTNNNLVYFPSWQSQISTREPRDIRGRIIWNRWDCVRRDQLCSNKDPSATTIH